MLKIVNFKRTSGFKIFTHQCLQTLASLLKIMNIKSTSGFEEYFRYEKIISAFNFQCFVLIFVQKLKIVDLKGQPYFHLIDLVLFLITER